MKNITLTISDWRWIRALRKELNCKHNSKVVSFLRLVYDSFPTNQQTELKEQYSFPGKNKDEDNWELEI